MPDPITSAAAAAVVVWGGKQAVKFAERAFGKATDEVGEYLVGEAKAWVARRRRVVERAAGALCDAGIVAERVPLKVARAILEGAGFEEDEELSERWAALLANAASPSGTVLPIFTQVLSMMTPKDAVLLDYFAGQAPDLVLDQMRGSGLNDEDIAIALASLLANGLVERLPSLGKQPGSEAYTLQEGFVLTELGKRFLLACKLPNRRPVV